MAHIQTLVHRCGPRTRILELGLHTDFIKSLVLSVLQAICVSSIIFFWFYPFACSHVLPQKGIYHSCKVAFRKVEGAGLEAKYSKNMS